LALIYAFILSFRTNSLEHIMTSPWTIRFRKIIPRFTLIGLVQPIVAHPIICVSACARGDRTPWSISSPDSTKNVICFVAVVDFCLRKIVLTGYLTRFTLSTSELCTTWVLSTQTLTWFGCWNTSFGGLLWPLKIPSSLPPQLSPFWYNLETLINWTQNDLWGDWSRFRGGNPPPPQRKALTWPVSCLNGKEIVIQFMYILRSIYLYKNLYKNILWGVYLVDWCGVTRNRARGFDAHNNYCV